ncbi:hypothetical protein LEP1GSC202_3845 [Leptospira yanagawae serovar Saopaulo str. Sao Paulo = ATCC 700523]|uniref:Uncharacterized protein n=1 Tax=Leptospira yanagawae serovar Saopaulo str. Sao Paulo = ATCC 700523 TaxID=1249483 RepID=A0A5E8HHN5_9LEPT|nr:hypothetical protein LEP1GSC202_3845 [Leptospira yanagawae serovar Saopaulo str. Sao Paulo = ATCC 700523]
MKCIDHTAPQSDKLAVNKIANLERELPTSENRFNKYKEIQDARIDIKMDNKTNHPLYVPVTKYTWDGLNIKKFCKNSIIELKTLFSKLR